MQRAMTTSGAPFVYWMTPLPAGCRVDIIFLPLSKGASPIRGLSFSSSVRSHPFSCAKAASAASVGSPVILPSGLTVASLQSAAQTESSSVFPVKVSVTVILFCVRVPVLSVHITCVQPSVSTAVSFRTMAFCAAMRETPMESTIVTTAASPSGIAATASDTATMKVSISVLPFISGAVIRSTANTITHIAKTANVSTLLSCESLRCSGVFSSAASVIALAIRPISVFIPVAVTTATPRP